VTFPEEYHAENLKGQGGEVRYHPEESGRARAAGAVPEEFIKRFRRGRRLRCEGLRAEVRKNMERELKGAVRNRIKSQAIDGLVNANDIDVPAALIDGEVDVLRRQAAQRFRRQREAGAGTAARAVRRAGEAPRGCRPAAGRSDSQPTSSKPTKSA
jgi:trigger factor